MNSANLVNTPRVFIIDDNIADCQFMGKCLLQAGYRADFATDSREGLASILQNPPQCLIINVILPGSSGYAICRQVRTMYPSSALPIIALSTKNTSLDQNYSFRMGANYYLPKPFTAEILLQTVQKMLPAFSPMSAQTPMPRPPTPQPIAPKTAIPQTLPTLIPYRQNETDIMLQNSPFARTSIIADRQLRYLYTLIDGNKTIRDLAEMMQLDLPSTLKLLKTLWQQQHIAFYDAKRRPFRDVSFFNEIK